MLHIGRKENVIIKIPIYKLNKKNVYVNIDIEAKIDSGAYGNSMHVRKIVEPYYSKKNECIGALVILDNGKKVFIKKDNYFFKNVKSSSGISEKRLATKIKIKIGNKLYKTTFTFTNRDGLRNKILLGRQILKNRFLIDVSKTNLLSI